MGVSADRQTWEQAEKLEPAPKGPKIGLALSGGGIRSATFNLGVLEDLRQRGYLEKVTHLSTVSGGGYIGAWLTANIRRQGEWLAKGTDWSDSIRHLRRHSNYLSPKLGFMSADTWTIAMVWLRNALLVQTTVFLLIAALLCVPRLLWYAFGAWPHVGRFRLSVFFLMTLALSGVAGNLLRLRAEKSLILSATRWKWGLAASAGCWAVAWWAGSGYERFGLAPHPVLAALAALALVPAGFLLVPVAVKFSGNKELNYGQGWAQSMVVLPMMLVALMVGAVMSHDTSWWRPLAYSYGELFERAWTVWSFPLAFVLGCFWLLAFASVDLKQKSSRLNPANWATPLLVAPAVTAALYAMLCGIQLLLNHLAPLDGGISFILAPPLLLYAFALGAVLMMGLLGRRGREVQREWWSRLGAWLGIYGVAWLVLASAALYGPWLAFNLNFPNLKGSATVGWVLTTIGGLLAGNSSSTSGRGNDRQRKSSPLEALTRFAPLVAFTGILILLATAVHVALLGFGKYSWTDMDPLLGSTLALAGALLAGVTIFAWRVDLNEFGLNAFYRSRLVRCYLGATRDPKERRPQNFTGFDPHDDLPLTDLRSPHYHGPIQIINTALNLGGSSDLTLHTRHCASFAFSAYSCGARRDRSTPEKVGYLPTECYTKDGAPTLGQAISISGAAASPNMGAHTSPLVAFLLTVFNVRLGWWFANPSGARPKATSPLFSIRYLVKELFGSAGEESNFLMLSDGGHFENLGIYELVRRRCDVIIAGDGEADPFLTFGSLGNVMRMCRVDFNATIDIDVRPIHPGQNTPLSESHYAVGSIVYEDGKVGKLIYLKSSVTGDEDTSVGQYRSDHLGFPHESTADQFFSEDQFESYRLLGQHVAAKTFGDVNLFGQLINSTLDSED